MHDEPVISDDDLIDHLAEAHTGSDFEVVCHRTAERMLAMSKLIEEIRIALGAFQGDSHKRIAAIRFALRAFDDET